MKSHHKITPANQNKAKTIFQVLEVNVKPQNSNFEYTNIIHKNHGNSS